MCRNIQLVNVLQRQLQEIVLVFPGDLGFSKLAPLSRRWRRVCDLGDQVGRRSLCDTVHEYTNEGHLQNNGKCKGKAEQNTLSVQEPSTLLLGGEWDPAEVWFKLEIISISLSTLDKVGSHKFAHQTA